jgi:quercetin dioxygenase-like cupin family protein
MGERLRLTPTATVAIVAETPGLLVVEAEYAEGQARPPAHLHPHQDERFAVHAGALHAEIGEEARILRAGDTLAVPHGVAHRMWAAEAPAHVTWETAPAGRTADFFRGLDALWEQEADPAAFAALLSGFDDVFRLA